MKAYRGSRGITLLIVNLGAGWRGVVRFKTRPFLPLGKVPAGWTPESVCKPWRRDKSLPLPRFELWTVKPLAKSVYQLLTCVLR